MKKLLTIALMLLTVLTAGAQEMELLDSIRQEPDPMYMERGGRTLWESKHMVFVINDNNTMEWFLQNPPHIFVGTRSKLTGKELPYSNARVGIFAENDSLLAITEKWKAVPSEHGSILRMGASATVERPNGEKVEISPAHIYLTLMKRKGSYVRVVADVYGDYYHEVKAKMNR